MYVPCVRAQLEYIFLCKVWGDLEKRNFVDLLLLITLCYFHNDFIFTRCNRRFRLTFQKAEPFIKEEKVLRMCERCLITYQQWFFFILLHKKDNIFCPQFTCENFQWARNVEATSSERRCHFLVPGTSYNRLSKAVLMSSQNLNFF